MRRAYSEAMPSRALNEAFAMAMNTDAPPSGDLCLVFSSRLNSYYIGTKAEREVENNWYRANIEGQ